MKKFISILLCFIIACSIIGCKASKHELENLAVIIAVGFDLTPKNDYMVTAQILNPQRETSGAMGGQRGSGQQGGSDIIIVSEKGATPTDAVSRLSTTLGRELFWAHNKFTVLGENLAKSGLSYFIDASLRSNQTRPDVTLLVAKGNASEIITAMTTYEKIPAVTIEALIRTQAIIGYAPIISRLDFVNSISGKSKAPIAAVIDFKENDVTGSNLNLAGTAVFKEDKLEGYLDMNETRGLNWIRGKIKGGTILSTLDDGNKVMFEILKSRSKVYPVIKNDDITIKIEIKEQANIREMTGKLDPMKNPELMEELSKVQDKAIENEVRMALRKAQKEIGADIFDFAGLIHRNYPEVWNKIASDWDNIFPNIKTEIRVSSIIKRPGVISKPIK